MIPLLALAAAAASPDKPVDTAASVYPLSVEASLAASAGPPALGGGFSAGARLRISDRLGAEVRLQEAIAAPELRVISTIRIGGTWTTNSGLMLRLGFAHGHEVSDELLLDKPVGAMLGSADGIVHRSGVTAGLAMNRRLSPRLTDRLGWTLALDVDAYPDRGGPPVYASLGGGVTLALGKRR